MDIPSRFMEVCFHAIINTYINFTKLKHSFLKLMFDVFIRFNLLFSFIVYRNEKKNQEKKR